MRVVATAGHVDHGKSALVTALTGTDPDRWAEERRRGLTIDLGFARLDLPSGSMSFVDVPGHERFLGNMLAGVGAVDACLFAVSAVEGWKAQSEEHLQILGLLGVTRGVVAVTFVDRVDADRLTTVTAQVRTRLGTTGLAGAAMVPVAAPAGQGLEAVRSALDVLVGSTPPATDHGRPRLWVDRAFTIKGAGTVVTGTLGGGGLAVGDRVEVAPGGPSSRVRGIQVHDRPHRRVAPGHRVALNVPDLAVDDVGRGRALVEPGRWHPATTIDARVTVLPDVSRGLTRRGAHLLHTGTGAWAVRLRVLHAGSIAPGATGPCRLDLPVPLPLRPGDRFVLRDAGVDATVGGGVVLDVAPRLAAGRARPDERWERVVAEHGWIDRDHLFRLTGRRVEPTVGSWVVDEAAQGDGRRALLDQVDGAGRSGVLLREVPDRLRLLLEGGLVPELVRDGPLVRRVGARPGDDLPWLASARAEPFRPPPVDDVPHVLLAALVARGDVVVLNGIAFAAEAVRDVEAIVRREARDRPEGVTVAEVRDALGTTRRYALALLGHLDRIGVTRRVGDRRVPGAIGP